MHSSSKSTKIVALITKIEISESAKDLAQLTRSILRLMIAPGRAEGFWSGEVTHPELSPDHNWKLIHRFETFEHADKWLKSYERKTLVDELCASHEISISEEILESDLNQGMVATAIVTDIKPGMLDAYFAWESKVQLAQAKFPGYRGVYWQPPAPGSHKWCTLLRFDSAENLENWFRSEERAELITEKDNLIEATKFQQVTNSFPGWFPVDAKTGAQTPKWKTALLLVLALFPVIVLQGHFVRPLLSWMNPVLNTFVNLVACICLTTFVTMPALVKVFRWWLMPEFGAGKSVHVRGILIVLSMVAVVVALLVTLLPR